MTKQETIAEITRRLVEFYQPVRIYLFGSEARGDACPDSDLDFCVILPDDAPESVYRDRGIHKRFWGLRVGVDVVRLLVPISTRARPMSSHRCQRPWCAKGGCSMTPDELLRDEAAKWLRQAAKGRNAAQVLVEAEPSRSVFHSQQAAEKAIQAFLTFHQIAFRKTHDLTDLGLQCATADPSLEPILRQVGELSDYVSAFRYPDAPYEP